MDQSAFAKADEQIDALAEIIDESLNSAESQKLKDALIQLSRSLGDRYSIGLDVVIHVFQRDNQRSMPLLTTGLGVSDESETYRTWGDSSPQRYVTDGEIQVVPHDRCPRCWGEWDFKFEHRQCVGCGAVLGTDVKILLDSDVCPHCESGSISASSPKCDKCGYEVDPHLVTWG